VSLGDYEVPKHDFTGCWSRRITDEHRLEDKLPDGEIRSAARR
jgi:Txe/YoeB family toxin of Txe-Axe toxin-antitoxin module